MFNYSKGKKKLFLLILIMLSSFTAIATDSMYNCWNNDDECLVRATLQKSNNTEDDNLPLEIDCTTPLSNSSVAQLPEYILRRFERAYSILLDGCHKSLKWPTYGFEYLPNCDKISKVSVTRFHSDHLYELNCPSATFMQVDLLKFDQNEIATVTRNALSNLSLLRELHFTLNSLRHIDEEAFDNLHFVEYLKFIDEHFLFIKNPTIFKNTNLVNIQMVRLKQVTSELFKNLPQTLREIEIEHVLIGVNDNLIKTTSALKNISFYISNPGVLRNISIIDCNLRNFELQDIHGTVMFLNLSSNNLENFQLNTNGIRVESTSSAIQIIDLSNNQIIRLTFKWFQNLNNLQELYLKQNFLKQLSLMPLLKILPSIQLIDLRTNHLEYFSNITYNSNSPILYNVRVRIDENPWNCKWLLNFAHDQPETYRIFQYRKFLSKINVNGLECKPIEISHSEYIDNWKTISNASLDDKKQSEFTDNVILDQQRTFNLIYGSNPYEIKRNQRTEALIIVFMLPVGIAILFVLLYLWIYCQKVFHLSFYRKCPFLKRRQQRNVLHASNSFEIVRPLPTSTSALVGNTEDGYELPLNGIVPDCNCTYNSSGQQQTNFHEKCQQRKHITYVPLPDERLDKIYEEIIVDDTAEEQFYKNSIYN